MDAYKTDGGPAFPVIAENGLGHISDGMSLRDWFAGQAIASIMEFGGSDMWNTDRQPPMAALAYEMADAMLAARQKP